MSASPTPVLSLVVEEGEWGNRASTETETDATPPELDDEAPLIVVQSQGVDMADEDDINDGRSNSDPVV